MNKFHSSFTMARRQILLLSSSNVHGHEYLQYSKNDISNFLTKNSTKKILFVPYASTKHEEYVQKVRDAVTGWGFEVEGLHTFAGREVEAVQKAEAIFVGGGNTFLLLKTLYEKKLVGAIRSRVLQDGVPYMGSSAGTNVATRSIHTTNDMPIVYPPSFDALKLVPFNINPHYLDPEPLSKHKGETREQRIQEFHELNEHRVVGLREGTSLLIDGESVQLIGLHSARLFQQGKEPIEYPAGSDLSFLMTTNSD